METKESLPRHVAIIMDGNGRWAKKRLLPRTLGHRSGMASLETVVRCCSDLKITALTVYAFSTENWKRPPEEVAFLMDLLIEYLHRGLAELNANNVCIRWAGRYEGIPDKCLVVIQQALEQTAGNTGLIFTLALNYGSRDELTRAMQAIATEVSSGQLAPEAIDETLIADHLYTRGLPDPDLLIRTAGEMRLSNFLLWQLAYTEIVVTDTLWPDFGEAELLAALAVYGQRDRRYGGLPLP
jgi:undecaprenyl diphosphate synthase